MHTHLVIAQINILPNQTAQALAEKLTGKGVTILNPQLTCPAIANGTFSVDTSNIGLDSGIVLTTGRAKTQGSSYGINGASLFLASTNNSAPGDASLNTLAGQTTYDACKLEFDVVPKGDTIKFDYVFSSEEYKNAVCGPYNDAFAFFISGPGISGTENMALVPGTNIPVTINSINNGVPGNGYSISTCNTVGNGSPFTNFYIDNSLGLTLTHQGLTTVLQAVHAVIPCNTYHLKMVIADAGNSLYDSGVFIKAGSLQSRSFSIYADTPLTPVQNIPYCVKGCLPGKFIVARSQPTAIPQTIKFTSGGTAISGIDYTALPDSIIIQANDAAAVINIQALPTAINGIKTLTLSILSPYNCDVAHSIIDSATMALYDTVHIEIVKPDTNICRHSEVPLVIIGEDTALLTYKWSPSSGLSNVMLKNPVATPDTDITYCVAAILPGSQCHSSDSISFTIKATPFISIQADSNVCINSKEQLNVFVSPVSDIYSYYWTGPDNYLSVLSNPVIAEIGLPMQGQYVLMVTNNSDGCSTKDSIHLNVISPVSPVVTSPVIICQNSTPINLMATGGNLIWYDTAMDSIGNTAPMLNTLNIGAQKYYVAQASDNCVSQKVPVDVIVEKCCDNILSIPNAFTPNGDGRNDRFEILRNYGYTAGYFTIYDRWGQLVFQTNTENGWDGTVDGKPADAGTYFYRIELRCTNGNKTERKGSFLLIR